MSRTIQSPGVEIRERDLTLRAVTPVGTNIFLAGYAPKGPADEVLQITSTQEFENVYGIPTNPAERYFYYSAKQVLGSSQGNLFVSRLPYGGGSGLGFGSSFGALVYPVQTVVPTTSAIYRNNAYINSALLGGLSATQISTLTAAGFSNGDVTALQTVGITTYIKYSTSKYAALESAYGSTPLLSAGYAAITGSFYSAADTQVTTNLDVTSGSYVLGAPKFFELTREEYNSILDGSAYSWSSTSDTLGNIASISDFGKAGVIVLNKGQSTINNKAEGYYIGLADNTNVEPNTDHNTILKIYTNNLSANSSTGLGLADFTQVPEARLHFTLSATSDSGSNRNNSSISQTIESVAYAFSDSSSRKFDDTLCFGVFKLRSSPYAKDTFQLDSVLDGAYLGSLDYHKNINSQTGGVPKTFYIGNVTSNDINTVVLVNDYISNRTTQGWNDNNGFPTKKVRMMTHAAVDALEGSTTMHQKFGFHLYDVDTMTSNIDYADALFPIGSYSQKTIKGKEIGSVTNKLDRALRRVENDEMFDLDLVIEGGLGTIYATCCANQTQYFDDTETTDGLTEGLNVLITNEEGTVDADYKNVKENYNAVFNIFNNFTSEVRKDCLYIADGLRQIFVKGQNTLISSDPSKSFSQYVYNPLKHLFENANSSYACAYANWVKINDIHAGMNIWMPFSPYAAATMANVDSNYEPWIAPAGFSRGRVNNILAVAIQPKQKERDMLMKVSANAVAFFPNDGINIFGQKTLLRQPSAFDRINVRRLFLYLEKATKKTCKYFVFEPNTTYTRNRVVATLTPIFEKAKNSQGLTDFRIIVDKNNNTDSVISNNELVVDIYIKPVFAAEFILVNFYSVAISTQFNEVVG